MMNDEAIVSKKAYLGRKDLYEIEIPDGVMEIGDWAFADCCNLSFVSLPVSVQKIGKGVVAGCKNLQSVIIRGLEHGESLQYLLAHALSEFEFPGVTVLSEVGTNDWMEWFDGRLLSYLQMDDADGFAPFLAGGEEDYKDVRKAKEEYCLDKQIRKLGFVSERMLLADTFPVQKSCVSPFVQFLQTFISNIDVLSGLLQSARTCGLVFMELYVKLDLLTNDVCQNLLNIPDGLDVELRTWILGHMKSKNVWMEFSL
ncbi:MAG: leucine-rich repeat protein [Wujia sp.]